MARIRTIKPDFWADLGVGECSPTARLLFIGCWNFSDDHGGLDRSAKQLKAQIFPYDSLDCEPLIQELLQHEMLIEYEIDGKLFLHIKNFRKHQRVEKPAAPRIPIYDESAKVPRQFHERSTNGSGAVTVLREGKGREGKGRDLTTAVPAEFLELKSIYPKRGGGQPWPKALKAIHARLREGSTWQQILDGARRYAEFIRTTGKTGTEFVKQAATFCGPDKSYLEDWRAPAQTESAFDEIMRLNGKSHPEDETVIEHDDDTHRIAR